MESSHYFLKTLGLESYIPQDTLPRADMDNFELDSKIKPQEDSKTADGIKDDICDKQDVINDEVSQITASIQADDFFSSLELQSSSKMTSNMISLGFSNKLTGGIVTRSRSFSSTLHETPKSAGRILSKSKVKGRPKKDMKKKRSEKVRLKRRIKPKGKGRRVHGGKKLPSDGKDKVLAADSKKQISNKLDENSLEKSLGLEKSKDDDDWILFNNLSSKKEIDDKMFENKQILASDMQNTARRSTPELFLMSSILMNDDLSEVKDEVDKLLEASDYDDSFLEEIEEFNYAPPRSHTGGKWKPGSLTIRTSPTLWQNQTWDAFLDDRNQDDERRHRADTPTDSPTESLNKFSVASTSGKWKSPAPPATYTGGKWKPTAPPAAHTGGKWRPVTPPATHTGGKWKPSEFGKIQSGPKKSDQELMSPVESDHNWKYESGVEPPPTHTGGKWKPSHSNELWKTETVSKPELKTHSSSGGKWGSGKTTVSRSTLDVLANCQSTSGKCLKTSGGTIQYYCSPCNRRLSSKKMYKKHIQSELHFKRVLQENELEFDPRSIKLFQGLLAQSGSRGVGKRMIKKPEIFKDSEVREKKSPTLVKIKGKRVAKREIIRCEVCKVKIPRYQLGKHLVSYYHSRRIQLNDPDQQKLILDNIHAIVKQAPYQCGMCRFYCNTHTLFKKHWALPVHKEMEKSENQRFWCVLCSFECETARSMELHLDSNSHREVILAVNKSIPIIIRHKIVFNCNICFKEFRYNRELTRHQKLFHKVTESEKSNKFVCPICQQNCKSIKSLQRHILSSHKGDAKIPYFCSTCNEFFNTAAEAKTHRNGQLHKYKKMLSEGGDSKVSLTRSCSYCGETLEDITKLKAHLLERHSEFLPKCMKCGMVFALSQELSQHSRNNECDFSQKKSQFSPSELFSCQSCAFSTNVKSEFLLHTALHQKKSKEEKKISCPLCGSFFTQTSLSIHLRTHLKERTYQCSVCSKAFVRRDRFVNHLKLKHETKESVEFVDVPIVEPETSKEKDEDKVEVAVELVAEEPEAEKKCEKKVFERRQICGDAKCKYVAKDLNDLETHSLFHIGPKVYQCPECPYSAKTNTIIKRHYMIHVDERSFPCHLCSFKARLKSHLKRHMRLHTGAKPYKCPHCQYSCNNLENLRKHVLFTKIHPGKKLYECKSCTFSTNVSKDYKMHLFKNHKEDYRLAEANEMAGIYNREEDCKNAVSSVVVKPRVPQQPAKKVYPAALKKKVELLTQKFSPIAPKPDNKEIALVKITGNSVEDKRKILKMELEKLKNQIKPSKKLPRSYPSPAEKDLKTSANKAGDSKRTEAAKKTPKDPQTSDVENGVVLVNVIPTAISLSEEPPSKAASQQQMELSSACILYENVLPAEDMELYLLENYQV